MAKISKKALTQYTRHKQTFEAHPAQYDHKKTSKERQVKKTSNLSKELPSSRERQFILCNNNALCQVCTLRRSSNVAEYFSAWQLRFLVMNSYKMLHNY